MKKVFCKLDLVVRIFYYILISTGLVLAIAAIVVYSREWNEKNLYAILFGSPIVPILLSPIWTKLATKDRDEHYRKKAARAVGKIEN